MLNTWIFDLDNTLYPASTGLVDQMNARIRQYLCRMFEFEEADAVQMQADLCREHGTTLRGLMVTRGVNPGELLAFEHDIDYSPLKPNPQLAQQLSALPGRKFVMTNSVAAHAETVLERLGCNGVFDGVFDLLAAELIPKPHPDTYRRFVEQFAIDPTTAIMIDDLQHNLEVPHRMGMRTVWLTDELDLVDLLRMVER